MNNIEIIKKLFRNKAIIQPSGWSIYSKMDAVDFVEECRKHSIQILGIDAFYLKENAIEPSMENSIDFTGQNFIQKEKSDIWNLAKKFLESKNDKLFFEIVV